MRINGLVSQATRVACGQVMHLVIFDIDGTLTQSMAVDAECFVRALAEVCGFTDIDTDWSRYRYVTDSGVFHEIYEERTRRSPTTIETTAFRRHFINLLEETSSKAPFKAVTGAGVLLARLAQSPEHGVALATGA